MNTIDIDRLRAVIKLRRWTIRGLAATADISRNSMYRLLEGKIRRSASFRESLRRALGPAAWAYVTRESDYLPT